MKRAITLILLIIMVVPYANVGAVPVLQGSTQFLVTSYNRISRTQELSLVIMALNSVKGKTEVDVSPVLDELTRKLLLWQNEDGGWGYYPNSPSDIVDTSYALIALARVKGMYMQGQDVYSSIIGAIDKGRRYILDSRGENGWGYVPDTAEACYPTLMAVWALGELGYTWKDQRIEGSIDYLNHITSCELPEDEAFGLKLIAYRAVGYPVDNSTLKQLKEKLFNETPSTEARAIMTYALTLYEPFNFDIAKALLLLEDEKRGFFWSTQTWMFSSSDIITTSSYALLALSVTGSFLKPEERPQTPYSKLCTYIGVLQNLDGGWGYPGYSSDPRSTYFALKGLQACYLRSPRILEGLNWTERDFIRETERVKELHTVTPAYYYLIKTLVEFGVLTDEERKVAIETIRSVKLQSGLWGNDLLGPQPLDTAFAAGALLELGVPASDADIQRAKSWLLSLSKKGWGMYVSGYIYSYMTAPNLMTTVEVLNALQPILSRDEAEPYISWLISQRNPDGSWSYWKVSSKISDIAESSKVEATVRVTNLLQKFGYDFTSETKELLMKWADENRINLNSPIDISLAATYLSKIKVIPHVNLYDIAIALSREEFKVIYPNGDNGTAETVALAIQKFFGVNTTISNETVPGKDNYIALGTFNTFNVDDYNPYISYMFNGSYVSIEGRKYSTKDTVLIIPGVTENGHVLFVLYNGTLGTSAVRTLFESGFVRYLHNDYLIIRYSDKNGDGRIELTEMEAILVG
ncbi:prenyltransferase/squalene oxidase repeat-containing protein [Thermococcus sp.]